MFIHIIIKIFFISYSIAQISRVENEKESQRINFSPRKDSQFQRFNLKSERKRAGAIYATYPVYRKRSVKTLGCKNRVSGVIRSPPPPSTRRSSSRLFPPLRPPLCIPFVVLVVLLPLLFRGEENAVDGVYRESRQRP